MADIVEDYNILEEAGALQVRLFQKKIGKAIHSGKSLAKISKIQEISIKVIESFLQGKLKLSFL